MALESLQPQNLWKHFENICNIPHPSGHEAQVAEYIKNFAKENNLDCEQDELGNVIIEKKAAPGCENKGTIILQSHMDMVPLASQGSDHDFVKDKIKTIIDDDFVRADNTTLGADDGIGVATALALLENPDLKCGPLRAIFTVEEETTMKGATGIDKKYLEGDYLINLDSEETYNLYVGCQGSADIILDFNVQKIEADNCRTIRLNASDFKGGHSGADIHRGRANAACTMAAVLNDLSDDFDFFIQDFSSGRLRNAISSRASIKVLVPQESADSFIKGATLAFERYQRIYKDTDPDMKLECSEFESDTVKALSYTDSLSLLSLILSLPLGALRMSSVDSSVTETSNNLGIVQCYDDKVSLYCMCRSLNDDSLDAIIARIDGICSQYDNVDFSVDNRHACWLSPDKNALIDSLKANFMEVTSCPLKVTVMAAGLECAMFAQKASDRLQLVSIGALVIGAHTPQERVKIADVNSIYQTVLKTLNTI